MAPPAPQEPQRCLPWCVQHQEPAASAPNAGDKDLVGVAGHRREGRACRDTNSDSMRALGTPAPGGTHKGEPLDGGQTEHTTACCPLLHLAGSVCSLHPHLQGWQQPAHSHHVPAGGSPAGRAEGDRLQEVAAHPLLDQGHPLCCWQRAPGHLCRYLAVWMPSLKI